MTEIFVNKKAVDDFEEVNRLRDQQARQPSHEGDDHPYNSRKQGTPVQPSDIREVLDFRA